MRLAVRTNRKFVVTTTCSCNPPQIVVRKGVTFCFVREFKTKGYSDVPVREASLGTFSLEAFLQGASRATFSLQAFNTLARCVLELKL